MTAPLPLWAMVLGIGCIGVILVRKGTGAVLRVLGRSFIAFLFLALLGKIGLMPGFVPGANAVNALILGVLGAPGFALLLLLPLVLI